MKVRTIVTGMIIMCACITGFLGNVVLTSGVSAHPTQTQGTFTFDRHAILPLQQLQQYAQKLNVTSAKGSTPEPSCITSATSPRCYSPQQIRTAYTIPGVKSKGHTIVLIDFATSPTLQSDVHLYDQFYGLKDPTINVFSPFSTPSTDPGYYTETALDIEMAHAIAPNATIDLVLANLDTATDYGQLMNLALQATQYAVQNNLGEVISQSFGVGESCVSASYVQAEQQVFAQARAKGITVLASSGDYGADVISCSGAEVALEEGVNLPAADPLVTAVGGTTLNADVGTGRYVNETAWSGNGNLALFGATSGGVSTLFPSPDYQNGITGQANRAIPDVAFDADPNTGVPIVFSQNGGLYIVPVGGTSVGSPAWAAIVVLANQVAGHRLGFLNTALYAISSSKNYASSFHDITTGNNIVEGIDFNGNITPATGYSAGQGWDAVTGIGTPVVQTLTQLLASQH
ncbi:MAG TPA: S53 family peptidase [Ktedonobacteraceae bacterium]